MQALHDRAENRIRYLLFERDGMDIGFALAVIYSTEDGKCFILEFCVLPEYRSGGTGAGCAEALFAWARDKGAAYFELCCDAGHRRRFWARRGFVPNGTDEWGMPIMLMPPEEKLPVTIEVLKEADNWQIMRLENSFLSEVGEEKLTEERKELLSRAIAGGEITFFLAKRGCRAVGMCSAAFCFSTFSCGKVGYFDDFYVEPAFRGQGTARKLAKAAQSWCGENGIASLSVCCAPCDEAMYRSLGFTVRLGTTLAKPDLT